jgi:hypothetical protein
MLKAHHIWLDNKKFARALAFSHFTAPVIPMVLQFGYQIQILYFPLKSNSARKFNFSAG